MSIEWRSSHHHVTRSHQWQMHFADDARVEMAKAARAAKGGVKSEMSGVNTDAKRLLTSWGDKQISFSCSSHYPRLYDWRRDWDERDGHRDVLSTHGYRRHRFLRTFLPPHSFSELCALGDELTPSTSARQLMMPIKTDMANPPETPNGVVKDAVKDVQVKGAGGKVLPEPYK